VNTVRNPGAAPGREVEAATAAVSAAALMGRPVASIDHTASVRDAATALASDGVGALVVLHGEAIVGVVAERDVVAHVALGADLDHLSVGDVMQGDVVTTTGDASAWEAARAMTSADVRHLPVLVDGCVAGMLSIKDVLAALSSPRVSGD
jgi:CBS domain-containing protein